MGNTTAKKCLRCEGELGKKWCKPGEGDHCTGCEKLLEISELNEEALAADGFEGAVIGHVQVFNKYLVLYDREKCIQILMDRDGMKHMEAEEYFNFNVVGSFVGEHTPAFAEILE